MSFGSILVMCFLIFALGGHDRIPIAPAPAEERAEAFDAGGEQAVAIASAEENSEPAAAAPPNRKTLTAPAVPPAPGKEIARAAGFPLSLPKAASGKPTIVDWMTDKGRTATIRYEFAGGGLLEYTQTLEDGSAAAETDAPAEPLPLPRIEAAKRQPVIEMAWQDGARSYSIRAYGVKERLVRAWIKSLVPPRPR